jgi:hypothetical protein
MNRHHIRDITLIAALMLPACDEDVTNPTTPGNNPEVITTVTLDFAPTAGGSPLSFRWADPENDGSPVIDSVVLADADDYTLAVGFLNELEDPAEEITLEVHEESDVHQVFFTGTAVESPATGTNPDAVITQAYADTDVNGFPVGLESDVTTVAPGTGTLTVTLRHMPAEGGVAVKTGDLADVVASSGIAALPGETDASVDFSVEVQ